MLWYYTFETIDFLIVTTSSVDLRYRARDEGNNVQHKDIARNLMGMGNNFHYTIKVKPGKIAVNCGFRLEFLQPTVSGPASEGRMAPTEDPNPSDACKDDTGTVSKATSGDQKYIMDEVEKQNTD